MIHLFIDTNRYLTFYEFPKKDLEEIKKLIELIRQKKIILWLPEQVLNEFNRNREERLANQYAKIDRMIENTTNKDIPHISESEEELKEIRDAQKNINASKNKLNLVADKLKRKFVDMSKKRSFLADAVANELFSLAKIIPLDETILKKADLRVKLRNPPGKDGLYGDAIIWETLLKAIPPEEDVHFVGFDDHFKSKLDETAFSPFLMDEWKTVKNSQIYPYNRLGDFIKAKIPQIKAPEEIRKMEINIDKDAINERIEKIELEDLRRKLERFRNDAIHNNDSYKHYMYTTKYLTEDRSEYVKEMLKHLKIKLNREYNNIERKKKKTEQTED